MKKIKDLSDRDLILYSQLLKKFEECDSVRYNDIRNNGYSTKFAYHVVRLINEVEQILVEGDLDITRNREQLKSIRRGEWKEEDIRKWFEEKEVALEKVYAECKLQHSPDEQQVKTLLLECLEHHYGNLDECVTLVDRATSYLKQIKEIVDKAGV